MSATITYPDNVTTVSPRKGALPFPTPFVRSLIKRALSAERYTLQHKRTWSQLYQVAKRAIIMRSLRTFTDKELVDYWVSCTPDSPSEQNYVNIEDLGTEFVTLSQSLHAEVVDIDNLEEHGDTFITKEEQQSAQQRLASYRQWDEDIRPVTNSSHLPKWMDHQVDHVDPDDEDLEDDFYAWGIAAIGAQRPDGIPIKWRKDWRHRKNPSYKQSGYPLRDCV